MPSTDTIVLPPEDKNNLDHQNPQVKSQRSPSSPALFVDLKETVSQGETRLPRPLEACSRPCLILNYDTEYVVPSLQECLMALAAGEAGESAPPRRLVTHQFAVPHQTGLILASPEQEQLALSRGLTLRHPVARSDFPLVDFLSQMGLTVSIYWREQDKKVPLPKAKTLTIDLYGYFELVDLPFLFRGIYLKWFRKMVQAKRIVHDKYLHLRKGKDKFQSALALPWRLILNDVPYRLVLRLSDGVATIGSGQSLDTFAETVGVDLPYKNLAHKPDPLTGIKPITRMHDWYFESPDEYDLYALGDVRVEEIQTEFKKMNQTITRAALGPDHQILPSPTIGSTVNKYKEAFILQQLGGTSLSSREQKRLLDLSHPSQLYDSFLKDASPLHVHCKTFGGRCVNAMPLVSSFSGIGCDMDISGAYTAAMSQIPYFYGTPRLWDETKRHMSLQTFCDQLQRLGIPPHHWQAVIQTRERLSLPQDLIPSLRDHSMENYKTDSLKYDPDSGHTTIYTDEIVGGLLTSNLLEVIRHTWSPALLKEVFDKITVSSALVYDPANQISLSKFKARLHPCLRNGTAKPLGHAWASHPLKDLGITCFQTLRKEHPKKTPLNTLYKLYLNTFYGITVSPFFRTRNPLVANNITAFVRSAVYCLEKGLGFRQTITDGGCFDVNKVYSPIREKLYTNTLQHVRTRDTHKNIHVLRKPLGGHSWSLDPKDPLTPVSWETPLSQKDALARIDALALAHVRALWPEVTCLQTITLEGKCLFTAALFHGSANYRLAHPINEKGEVPVTLKMRSHENKTVVGFTLDPEGNFLFIDTFGQDPPATYLFTQLRLNPRAVVIPPPFLREAILKTGDYSNHFTKWDAHGFFIGDAVPHARRLRFCTLNLFRFRTHQQKKTWLAKEASLLKKWGLSFELFFLKKQGETLVLDWVLMNETLLHHIDKGVGMMTDPALEQDKSELKKALKDLTNHLDKSRHMHRDVPHEKNDTSPDHAAFDHYQSLLRLDDSDFEEVFDEEEEFLQDFLTRKGV